MGGCACDGTVFCGDEEIKNVMEKTILIPVYNGFVSKNFFPTNIYKELIRDPRIRLVIVIPSSKLEFYRNRFQALNLTFEVLDGIGENWLGEFLSSFAFNLLRTRTIWFRQRERYLKFGNFPKFMLQRAVNFIFGPFLFSRKVVRWLDRFVPSDDGVLAIIKKYKPDLLLAPDVAFGIDRVFLRACKRSGISVIGMVRSWDNLTSKGTIQLLPDKLILYTDRMRKQAIQYTGISNDDIIVTGPPGYDEFFRPRPCTRDEFCRAMQIDPKRRIVLFAPFYDRFTGSAIIMLNTLLEAIDDGRLPNDLHILVRYRPATPEIPVEQIRTSDHVSFSQPCQYFFPIQTQIAMSRKDWEFDEADLQLMINSLYFSEMMINTFSTLTIDAVVFDKPMIGIRYDADPATPPIHSVKYVPDRHDHYRELEDTKGVKLVYNNNELIDSINAYLKNPALDREGRERMRNEQIQFYDGMCGKRIAEYVKKQLFVVRVSAF